MKAALIRTFNTIFADFDSSVVDGLDAEKLAALLSPISPGIKQRTARVLFHYYSLVVPKPLRLMTLKLLKRARNTARKELVSAKECEFNKIVGGFDRSFKRRGYAGKKSCICLSYDIDREDCYAYLGELKNILESFELPSTWNILTGWEYQIDWGYLKGLITDKIDIGLHGHEHDISFGYRNKSHISAHLQKSIDAVPFELKGYRAPALSMSRSLMDIVEQKGFIYDSSLPMSNMYYHSCESAFPYVNINNQELWEHPVTLQDSTLFLDMRLSQEDAFKKAVEMIEEIIDLGGVNCINLHPYIVRVQTDFHKKLLEYVSALDDIYICSHEELNRLLNAAGNNA